MPLFAILVFQDIISITLLVIAFRAMLIAKIVAIIHYAYNVIKIIIIFKMAFATNARITVFIVLLSLNVINAKLDTILIQYGIIASRVVSTASRAGKLRSHAPNVCLDFI